MKLPFSFNLSLVFRLLFPGTILAVGVAPLLATVIERAGVIEQSLAAFVVAAIFFGWLMIVLDMPIYMIFEGRRFWPGPVKRFFVGREQARLNRLEAEYRKAKVQDERERMRELSVDLRQFPMDEHGQFFVYHPTRLGNLIYAFEDYTHRMYGMYATFYWTRIWQTLEKHQQEDIDGKQALTDSVLYSVTALYLSGLLGLFYAIIQAINLNWIGYLPDALTLVVLSVGAILAGYIIYRLSLRLFAQFGEIFKAVFDVYHHNVEINDVVAEVANITGDASLIDAPEKRRYQVAWRYLHNYRVKFEEGGPSYTLDEARKTAPTRRRESAESRPAILVLSALALGALAIFRLRSKN